MGTSFRDHARAVYFAVRWLRTCLLISCSASWLFGLLERRKDGPQRLGASATARGASRATENRPGGRPTELHTKL